MVKNITGYGISIKKRLTDLGKSQNWLIESVREKTGLFFDTSYLHKIMTGKEKSKKIVDAINEILEIGAEDGQNQSL